MGNTKQVGGEHYQKYKIQPLTWALEHNINAAEFSILRYVLRYKDKNGLEDLQKAMHYAEVLEECEEAYLEEGERRYVPTEILTTDIYLFCMENDLVDPQSCALIMLFKQNYCVLKIFIQLMMDEANET